MAFEVPSKQHRMTSLESVTTLGSALGSLLALVLHAASLKNHLRQKEKFIRKRQKMRNTNMTPINNKQRTATAAQSQLEEFLRRGCV